MDDTDARKRALRAEARARRAGADPAVRAAGSAGWTAGVLELVTGTGAAVVAAYVSYGTEPPTADLIEALTARGVRVLLPVLREDRDLDWESDGARLGREAIADAGLVVAPALLVGRDGARLGQGGGSYDRALTRVRPGTPVAALVHDDEVVDAGVIPVAGLDVPVTHAVTPGRVVVLGAADLR